MAPEDKPKRSASKLDARDPEAALGPPNPEAPERTTREEKDMSPADLELRLTAPAGEEIIVKSNPETPTAQQIGAATTVVAGPAVTTVSVKGVDGNERSEVLTPDNAALLSQRAVASDYDHPAHTTMGWSNPNLGEMSDEEREKDQKDYAARVKASA